MVHIIALLNTLLGICTWRRYITNTGHGIIADTVFPSKGINARWLNGVSGLIHYKRKDSAEIHISDFGGLLSHSSKFCDKHGEYYKAREDKFYKWFIPLHWSRNSVPAPPQWPLIWCWVTLWSMTLCPGGGWWQVMSPRGLSWDQYSLS